MSPKVVSYGEKRLYWVLRTIHLHDKDDHISFAQSLKPHTEESILISEEIKKCTTNNHNRSLIKLCWRRAELSCGRINDIKHTAEITEIKRWEESEKERP